MGFAAKEMKRLFGKAIHARQMIKDGDHVLVAVSGGKDSLSLLWLLKERLRRVPISYRITAVFVNPGFRREASDEMEGFFKAHAFEWRVVNTAIGPLAHSKENLENPCFLCSRLRRKELFEAASQLGCNRIAFGHHKDDIIETFFLNVFYGASISTMQPVQPLFGGELTVIRPLYLADEGLIIRYAASMALPKIDLGCPTAGSSKRQDIKNMLDGMYRSNRKIKGNIFHALHNVNMEYLL